MRLLTLLLAALVAGLAFLWGGEAGSDDPLLPTAPVAATPDAPRGRPDGLPEEQLEDREVPAAGPAVARREAVAPASVDLDLRLVHAVDGSPLEPGDASIQVWQLGLAADEEWTAGDRKVFDGPVTAGQVLLRDLAPGRYRAFVWDARLGSTVPPAFDLAPRPDGTAVVVTWPVEPAVAEPIWLVVVDEAGEPVEPVLRRNRNSWRLRTHGGMAPDWARERRKRDELGHAVGIGGGVGGGGGFRRGSHMRWIELEPAPEGLPIGTIVQDSRRIGRTRTEYLRQHEDHEITVVIEPRGSNRFHVVLPDRAAVLERLALPDEELRERAESALSLRTHALPLGPERGETQAWREAVVEVSLHLAGYQPLEVTWRPAVEPPPALVLQPSLATDG